MVLLLGSITPEVGAEELNYSDIDRATVRVFAFKGVGIERSERGGRELPLAVPEAGHGSGVLVGDEGLVLTARHVVDGAKMVSIQLPGAADALPARPVHLDSKRDLAWLAIGAAPQYFVTLPEQAGELAVRDSIFVVGYPLDAARNDPQSARGVISGKLPDGSLQLGISLNPGNSGGPVITQDEQLVGIAVARADPKQGAEGIGVAVPVSQVLESALALADGRLLDAGKKALVDHDEGDRVRANVLRTLMTSSGMADALRLTGQPEGPEGKRFWKELKQAILAVGKESPQLYLLAASRHFNNAVWRSQAGSGAWASAMRTAQKLVDQAVEYDATLASSPFVQLVRRTSRNTGTPPNAQSSSGETNTDYDTGTGTEDALEPELDLEVLAQLPTFGLSPTLSVGYNTLLVSGGLTGWLYLGEAVNVTFDYQYGVMLGAQANWGHHGELFGGIVLSKWRGATVTKLVVDVEHGLDVVTYTYTKRRLPTYSAFIVEMGGIVSPLQYHYCDEVCQRDEYTWPEYSSHVTTLAAGVRYRYFYHAGGYLLARNARQVLDVAAHALAFDFAAPEAGVAYSSLDDEPLEPLPVGFRVQFSGVLTPWSSSVSNLSLGVLPANGTVFARAGVTHYFY